tara:strand:- start:771 stop:1706 length:936 start_codon:yes stop_codon:yes gene_type:complete
LLEFYPPRRKLINPVPIDRIELTEVFGVRSYFSMDEIYRLTSSEYAKLIGISNEALRSRRRRNQEEGNYKKVGSDYFWMTPLAGRPNMAVTVANDRGPRYGIPVKNVKRKRRRGVVARGEQTNYHEAPNGWQLEQANQIKALGKIRDGLGDEVVDEITPELFELAKKKIQAKKDKEFKDQMDKAQKTPAHNIVGLDNTPQKYGTMLNAKGIKQVEDKKHAALLRRDNNKHGLKYINKYDMEGRLYRSNQLDFSDPGGSGIRFGSGNSYYNVGAPTNDGSVGIDERDLPPDDREPIFRNKIEESIWRLKKNK